MATLVDSSVVIDVITGDPVWGDWSRKALTAAQAGGDLLINQVIYAETIVAVRRAGVLDRFLRRRPLPWEAAALAGDAHYVYRRRGGARDAILADFLIGAHAQVERLTLLTRDPRRVRTAFPDVAVVAPDGV